ncbi:MAG: hypothetical protein ABIJ34_03190 [archaeon]
MYNKCDKCGKQLGVYDQRKLVLDAQNKITTRCMACYEVHVKIKASQ